MSVDLGATAYSVEGKTPSLKYGSGISPFERYIAFFEGKIIGRFLSSHFIGLIIM